MKRVLLAVLALLVAAGCGAGGGSGIPEDDTLTVHRSAGSLPPPYNHDVTYDLAKRQLTVRELQGSQTSGDVVSITAEQRHEIMTRARDLTRDHDPGVLPPGGPFWTVTYRSGDGEWTAAVAAVEESEELAQVTELDKHLRAAAGR